MSLKCQFHIHTAGDPLDSLLYEPKELIKEAARQNYDVIAITCHRRVLFSKHLQKYASKKGILLLPGIETEIKKQHIIIINAHTDIYNVATFDELRAYKTSHPESLIIAPHPFFPGPTSLKKNLITNIDIFDAIEYSYFYTKTVNFNTSAVEVAKKFNKPLIATSDCHVLRYLDQAHCLIDSAKNIHNIISSIKQNRVKNIHKPLKIKELFSLMYEIFIAMTFRKIFNKKVAFEPTTIDFSAKKC